MVLIAYDEKPRPMRAMYRLFAATGFLGFLNHPMIFELWYGPIRRAAPGIGAPIVIVALIVWTCLYVWRTLTPLFGSNEAVATEADHVIVRTPGKTRRIGWRDLDRIAVRGDALYFHAVRGGAFGPLRIAVPLRLTTLHRSRWQAMLGHLQDLQAEALGGPRTPRAGETVIDAAPASDFDPDAALARYLARKAAAATPQAAQPVLRPGGFGRKGV